MLMQKSNNSPLRTNRLTYRVHMLKQERGGSDAGVSARDGEAEVGVYAKRSKDAQVDCKLRFGIGLDSSHDSVRSEKGNNRYTDCVLIRHD